MNLNELKLKKGIRPVYFKGAGEMKGFDLTKREVHMILNAFGNKDDDGDIVQKGAFAKSLLERGVGSKTDRKIAYLKFHDMKMPLGTFKELYETDRGLEAVGRIDETALGDETLIQIQNKTLNQHSIGFEYIWDKIDYDETNDAFIVKEINLWEGSLVVLGTNENTGVLEVRGKDFDDQVAEVMSDLEKHLKGIEYKSQYDLRRVFSKVLTLVEHATLKPSKDTLKPDIKTVDWSHIAKAIQLTTKNKSK